MPTHANLNRKNYSPPSTVETPQEWWGSNLTPITRGCAVRLNYFYLAGQAGSKLPPGARKKQKKRGKKGGYGQGNTTKGTSMCFTGHSRGQSRWYRPLARGGSRQAQATRFQSSKINAVVNKKRQISLPVPRTHRARMTLFLAPDS